MIFKSFIGRLQTFKPDLGQKALNRLSLLYSSKLEKYFSIEKAREQNKFIFSLISSLSDESKKNFKSEATALPSLSHLNLNMRLEHYNIMLQPQV